MTEHLRQIHDACGKLVLYHIVMMFLLKRRRDDHYNLISSFTELQKFTIFALSPVHTTAGTFETFFYTNRSFLCSHETSKSAHSSAAFSVKKRPLVWTGAYYHHTVSRTRSRSRPRI